MFHELNTAPMAARSCAMGSSGNSCVLWARTMARYARDTGGALTEADLAAHSADWVEPISIRYRDVELHEIGPNGQGIAAQMALGMLEHFDLKSMEQDSALATHLKIEAMKLAFADLHEYVGDVDRMTDVTAADLLNPAYLAKRCKLIDLGKWASNEYRIAGDKKEIPDSDREEKKHTEE